MTSRRQFIQIVPFTGAALIVGCSEKAAAPTASTTPAIAAAPVAPAAVTPAAVTPAVVAPAAPAASPTVAPATTALLPLVDEKDATASALGFATDAAKADGVKFKSYAAGQNCGSCVLYQGAAGSAQGGCPLFAGRHVSAKSWCSSFAKKPA